MKNYIQFVTTEGLKNYDARGMDCIFKFEEEKFRIDISPKIYQNHKFNRERMRENNEIRRQANLLNDTKIIFFTHGHNDHFWTDILKMLDKENKNEFGYYIEANPIVFYPKSISDYTYLKYVNNHLTKEQLEKRIKNIEDCSFIHYEIGSYMHTNFNNIEIEINELKHSTYKGFDLGKIHAITITTPKKVKIFFSSDISGPEYDEARDIIIDKDPNILLLDGPYNDILSVLGNNNRQTKKAISELKKSYLNLKKIVSETKNLKKIVLMHHFMRNMEPNFDIKNIPIFLNNKIINNKKLDDESKLYALNECMEIEETILNILDIIDEKEINIYLPSMFKDNILKI